jgi:hypothetical protein
MDKIKQNQELLNIVKNNLQKVNLSRKQKNELVFTEDFLLEHDSI